MLDESKKAEIAKQVLIEEIVNEGKRRLEKILRNYNVRDEEIPRIKKRIMSMLESGQDYLVKEFLMNEIGLQEEEAKKLVDEVIEKYLKFDPII